MAALAVGSAPGDAAERGSAAFGGAGGGQDLPLAGDADCDGDADSVDALAVLRTVAGLNVTAGCLGAANVVCTDGLSSVDALMILRSVVQLPVNLPDVCLALGERFDAESLAGQLLATDNAAAAEALLRLVYPQLGIGLYTAEGEQIIAGAETGPEDFYLYDFESTLLALGFTDRQPAPLDVLAEILGQLGIGNLNTGEPITAAELQTVLADAVVRGRSDESLLTVRLIDGLGLAREEPLDLTNAGDDPALVFLDPLQQFLVLFDILAGLEPEGASGASPPLLSSSGGACDFRAPVQVPRKGGRILSGSELGEVQDIRERLQQLHLELLKWGYAVSLEPPIGATHWKHFAGENARDLRFVLTVRFDLGPLQEEVRCGRLQGFNFPPRGPVGGADVEWKLLGRPISLDFLEALFLTPTNNRGEAEATLKPKVEPRPGEGQVKTRNHFLSAITTVLVPPGLGLDPGTILLPLKQAEIIVERHESCPADAGTQGVGAAFAPQGAAAEYPFPCGLRGNVTAAWNFSGSASGTSVDYNETLTTQVDLRAAATAYNPPVGASYENAGGTTNWVMSGTSETSDMSCTFTGSDSAPVPAGPEWANVGIFQSLSGEGYTIIGTGGTIPPAGFWQGTQTCTGPDGTSTGPFPGFFYGWLMTDPAGQPLTFSPDGSFSGEYTMSQTVTISGVTLSGTGTFTWHFDPIDVCPAAAATADGELVRRTSGGPTC